MQHFIFKYEEHNDDIEKNILNPFEICHDDDCQNNISTYNFKKGESYTIKVNFQKVFNDYGNTGYILPGFSFYNKDYKDEENSNSLLKFNILSSLFISLLLL